MRLHITKRNFAIGGKGGDKYKVFVSLLFLMAQIPTPAGQPHCMTTSRHWGQVTGECVISSDIGNNNALGAPPHSEILLISDVDFPPSKERSLSPWDTRYQISYICTHIYILVDGGGRSSNFRAAAWLAGRGADGWVDASDVLTMTRPGIGK